MSKTENEQAALEKVVMLESALAGRRSRQQLLVLTYTQSRAVETAMCVAEQQPPTTGGRPALTPLYVVIEE